jgi:porphobilinogen synthase
MARMAKLTLRRTRKDPVTRNLTREVRLSLDQFVQPSFVVEGLKERDAVPGLTDVFRETPDSLLATVERDLRNGIHAQILFGVPADKRERDFDPSFTARQIASLKRAFGDDLWVAADVCLCSSTTHGHCGILTAERDHVDNGATVDALADVALAYAEAGADCVAPSDMMDGRIGAIRRRLDDGGCERTLVMSYAAKFHSRLYGPFRVAADSAPGEDTTLRDRATYQIDPARPTDAFASAERDAAEGADILMVKPGLLYLDVLKDLSARIPRPWAVYEVSGEFAALESLAAQGLAPRAAVHIEAWTALARAGASIIISYGARYAREWLAET